MFSNRITAIRNRGTVFTLEGRGQTSSRMSPKSQRRRGSAESGVSGLSEAVGSWEHLEPAETELLRQLAETRCKHAARPAVVSSCVVMAHGGRGCVWCGEWWRVARIDALQLLLHTILRRWCRWQLVAWRGLPRARPRRRGRYFDLGPAAALAGTRD